MAGTTDRSTGASTRERIVDAAARLLADGGPAAVSTRAVCDAAGVQAPTIYRLFDSKEGLLGAVAERGFLEHMQSYATALHSPDPLEDLRRGWDLHVEFGLANPYLYAVMYGHVRPNQPSAAAVTANDVLNGIVHRVGEAGLLRLPETEAAFALNAAGCGVTLSLIGLPTDERDPALSPQVREAVVAHITRSSPAGRSALAEAATTLAAHLGTAEALTIEERALLHQWLERLGA